MKSYLVEIGFFQVSSVEFLHFISDSPLGSEAFFNDAYDAIFSHGYDISDFMILCFEEGF